MSAMTADTITVDGIARVAAALMAAAFDSNHVAKLSEHGRLSPEEAAEWLKSIQKRVESAFEPQTENKQ